MKDIYNMDLLNPSCSNMKKRWIDELIALEDYLYRTMGEDNILDIPFSGEEDENLSNISSRMSIKPTRDGKTALDAWGNFFSNNRLIRALIDYVEMFEAKYADATTYMILLAIAIIKLVNSGYDTHEFDVKETTSSIKKAIIDRLELFTDDKNREKYIRTAISCLDDATIDAVTGLLMKERESHIQIVKNGYPKYAEYKGHVAIEHSDGSKILSLHSLPSIDFNGRSRLLVINGVITFDLFAQFLDINNLFIQSVCVKAEEEGNLVAPLIILARHVDYASKKLLDLLSKYGIILIAHNNNSSLECRNVLARCARTICIDINQKIDVEFMPEAVRISLKTVERFQNKVFYINEDVHKSFAPNERNLLADSIQNEMRHPMTDERKSELATMKNLIASNAINLYIGGFDCQYKRELYYGKIHDVILAHGLGILGRTTPCIYGTLSTIHDELLPHSKKCIDVSLDDCIDCQLFYAIDGILCDIHRFCYSKKQIKSDSIRDLYEAVKHATIYACDYVFDMCRTTFMVKFNPALDEEFCIFPESITEVKKW